jgi:aconitate hydratase
MQTLTRKILAAHLVEGKLITGSEIGLKIDQTLVQDATGTMVWQQFHSFGLPCIKAPQCVTYNVETYTGPNIVPPPPVTPLADSLSGQVLLKLGDNISTGDILPGGNDVLPLRSNIPAISEYTFAYVDRTFPERSRKAGGGFVVGGENWGQGSSREHAAIAPMYLGVRAILAKSFARIHESNLINFGIVPLRFTDPHDYAAVQQGDELKIPDVRAAIAEGQPVVVLNKTQNTQYSLAGATGMKSERAS